MKVTRFVIWALLAITIGLVAAANSRTRHPADQPWPPDTYYRDCAAVRRAAANPLHTDEPGFRPGLDPNHDGVACE